MGALSQEKGVLELKLKGTKTREMKKFHFFLRRKLMGNMKTTLLMRKMVEIK